MSLESFEHANEGSPLLALKERWWLAAILIPLCTILGLGAAMASKTVYTAEARLNVAAGQSNAYLIAGFPLAAQELAADYARWVVNNSVGNSLNQKGTPYSVSASPIPESATVRIEVDSTDDQVAVAQANAAAQALVKAVAAAKGQQNPDNAFKELSDLAPKVADASTKVDALQSQLFSAQGAKRGNTASLTRQLNDAKAVLTQLKARQDASAALFQQLFTNPQSVADLKQTNQAFVSANDRKAKMQRLGLIGFGLGAALALALAGILARRDLVSGKKDSPATSRLGRVNRGPAARTPSA